MGTVAWVERSGPGRLGVLPDTGTIDWFRDHLHSMKQEGIDVLVNLLTDEEMQRYGMADEPELLQSAGFAYVHFPIENRSVPRLDSTTLDFLRALKQELAEGKRVAVHCHSGRGRSSLVTAGVMVLEGQDPNTAMRAVGWSRLVPVPDNRRQTLWVRALADHVNPLRDRSGDSADLNSALGVVAAVGAAAAAVALAIIARRR